MTLLWGRAFARSCLIAVALIAIAVPLAMVARPARALDPAKVEKSVYKINVLMRTKDGMGTSSGTGFLVSGRRIVATNHHVVEDGIRYIIAFVDGRTPRLVEARLIDTRPHLDLALLEAYEDLPGEAFPLAEYKPDKLSEVVAIGYPGKANVKSGGALASTVEEWIASLRDLSLLDASHTPGKVSRVTVAAGARLSDTQVVNALTVQHNAPINPGNSGGPLVDNCGEVVGVNSFNPTNSQGIFFSIHASEVARILSDNRLNFQSAQSTCGQWSPWSVFPQDSVFMPLIVGMTAMFAMAAGFVMLRSRGKLGAAGASLGALTRFRPQFSGKHFGGIAGMGATRNRGYNGAPPQAIQLKARSSGATWSLDQSGRTATVGRHPSRDVVIADETVSSTHARLAYDAAGGRFHVTDLGSSNGTFLNGKRVASAHFHVGDTLRFGTAEVDIAASSSPGAMNYVGSGAQSVGWMLSGFDAGGRAVQLELIPEMDSNGHQLGSAWTIGRDPSRSKLVIDDSSLSGLHAQITFVPGQGLVLRDLGSTNGTQIDGTPAGTRDVTLSHNAHEIIFGGVRLRLSMQI